MKLAAIILSAALLLAAPLRSHAAEVTPIDQLPPLPLSFWTVMGSEPNGETVRTAYLRGFFEASRIWADVNTRQPEALAKYLFLVRGMNLVQVANLLERIGKEPSVQPEKLALGEALTAYVIRARMGLPLLGEAKAHAEPVKPEQSPAKPEPPAAKPAE